MRQPGAFTLLELLLAVWVIGVLIALFAPSFAQARREAQRVGCLSNLRSFGQALAGYYTDHDAFPLASYLTDLRVPRTELPDSLSAYLGSAPSLEGDEAVNLGIWKCPSDRGVAPRAGSSYAYWIALHLGVQGGFPYFVPPARHMAQVRRQYQDEPIYFVMLSNVSTPEGIHPGNPHRLFRRLPGHGASSVLYGDGAAGWMFSRDRFGFLRDR